MGKTTPFPMVINNTKYLGVIRTKQMKDLYDKKRFKTLKKISEDRKFTHAPGSVGLNSKNGRKFTVAIVRAIYGFVLFLITCIKEQESTNLYCQG